MSIQNILDVYAKIADSVVEKNQFSSLKFRNTLEPIFEREGYRKNLFDTTQNSELRIMILQDASIGDFILLSPCIREIRRLYPAARITLVIHDRVHELAMSCPYVDEVIKFNAFGNMRDFRKLFRQFIEISQTLLERHFDIAFLFNHFMTTSLLAYMSGARDRIISEGQGNPLEFGINPVDFTSPLVTTILPRLARTNHAVDNNLKILDHFMHSPILNRELEIWYTPQDLELAKKIFEQRNFNKPCRVYSLTLGGTRPDSWYPPQMYAKFVKTVLENDPNACFILLGWKKELPIIRRFLTEFHGQFVDRVLNLASQITLRQCAAIISLCTAHVGNDTGTMHIAAANHIPCLEVTPYPADQKLRANTVFLQFAPYHVPAVVVQPAKSLPECVDSQEPHGCRIIGKPHCITQIHPQKLLDGFALLHQKMQRNDRSLSMIH